MIKGLDISHWNTIKDFNKLKNDFDFVILKAGGSDAGFYKDSCFEDYYTRAKEAGFNVGAYYFAGKNFLGRESGEADAVRFIELLKGKQFEYPVFLDIEAQSTSNKKLITEAAYYFCKKMEEAGYFVGIYASDISGFMERLDCDDIINNEEIDIDNFVKWVARYSSKEPVHDYGIWQYTSCGCHAAAKGMLDCDKSKIDYSEIIKKGGFNGWVKKTKKTRKTT